MNTLQKGIEGKHVIDFYWEGFIPHIVLHPVLFVEDTIKHKMGTGIIEDVIVKPGDTLNYSVSKRRWCVGTFSDTYSPCPFTSFVKNFPLCQRCRQDIGKPPISEIFEPDKSGCEGEFCSEPHVVYLAFYGERIKVGMTPERRLLKRSVEQGADAVGIISYVKNRVQARKMERELSKKFRIPQALSVREIMLSLTRKTNPYVARRRVEQIRHGIGEEGGEIIMLKEYPIKSLTSTPRMWRGKDLRGKIIGIKGRYVLIDKMGPTAVNMRKIIGRVLLPPAPLLSTLSGLD